MDRFWVSPPLVLAGDNIGTRLFVHLRDDSFARDIDGIRRASEAIGRPPRKSFAANVCLAKPKTTDAPLPRTGDDLRLVTGAPHHGETASGSTRSSWRDRWHSNKLHVRDQLGAR